MRTTPATVQRLARQADSQSGVPAAACSCGGVRTYSRGTAYSSGMRIETVPPSSAGRLAVTSMRKGRVGSKPSAPARRKTLISSISGASAASSSTRM